MTRKTGMLISDEEIKQRYGDVLPVLDADPATRAYQPYWNGKRFRPAVENKLTAEQVREQNDYNQSVGRSPIPPAE